MNHATNDPGPEQHAEHRPSQADGQELKRLLVQWRDGSGLSAGEEHRLAALLRRLARAREGDEVPQGDDLIRVLLPVAEEARLGDEEREIFVREMGHLVSGRELTKEEKDELAGLFDRYRMRLWAKLRRTLGAASDARYDPDDVLSETYLRAETRWTDRPADPAGHYVWLYGLVHDQLCDMIRRAIAVKRGGRVRHEPLPDNSAAEIALKFWQSRPGVSTMAARDEFVAKARGFLERNLSPADRELFSMRVFDRLEYAEIVAELARRSERNGCDGAREILDKLDSRARDGDDPTEDRDARRADAVRKRFKRAVAKLAAAFAAEFPELLDSVPGLGPL
jgi:DNA-directed RNA polymerase specialized sigma24 family protein